MTVKVQIIEINGRYLGYRGLHLTEALARDETGYLRIVWFNQPYRKSTCSISSWYYLSGLYDFKNKRLQLINPSSELIDQSAPKMNLVRPIYPTTIGLKSIQIQKAILQAKPLLENLKEILPPWMIEKAGLASRASSYQKLHFPQTIEETNQALSELNLRELISLSLGSQILKLQRSQQAAKSIPFNLANLTAVTNNLNFELTKQQKNIINSVLGEMEVAKNPLNRLIQGDVGAGKTLIAALIAFNVIKNGYQVAFLAPTQILANQHFKTLKSAYGDLFKIPQMEVFTSAIPTKEKNKILNQISNNETNLIIGTHALLSEAVEFNNLALVIIDEQHRFGVEQRLKLLKKARPNLANILTLSATPIPRSLALAIYADLDITLLTEKPSGRLPVKTSIIPLKQRAQRLKEILKTRSAHNQIYIVCPAIEGAEIEDSLTKIEAYIKGLDPKLKYAVLHAQLKVELKEKIMLDFVKGKYEVLLSTSIIGSGIDILNANTIIIMSPERFGLTQLHQFRGRVGRNDFAASCYLCPYSDQPPSERLQAVLDYEDGFKLSEIDLKLRGPGSLHGVEQSGIENLFENGFTSSQMIETAVSLAKQFILKGEDLNKFKDFKTSVTKYQQITHLN